MRLCGAGDEVLGRTNSGGRSKRLATALFGLLASCSAPMWSEGPTFFFEVETDAGTSYLLGTTHVGVAFDELSAHVHDRLASVSFVGFETDPSAPLVDDELQELGLIPRYEPILSQRLDPEVWSKLVVLLEGRVQEPQLRRFKPWLARFALGLAFIDGLPRLENEIEAEARAKNKTLFHLEAPREQLEVLASIPEAEVLATLSLMASDPEGARQLLEDTFEAYGKGDAVFFVQNYLEPTDSVEVELLIRARNRRWVEPIRARFEGGPTFLAVGAAHLVGPDGLLVLLEGVGLELRSSYLP